MSAFAPNGEPIDVYNHYINFGAEYVYHCHILSHEEMDMMRPVTLAYPPMAPSGLAFNQLTGTLSWTDNSRSETAFVIQKSQDGGISWSEVGRIDRTLFPNTGSTTGGVESFTDPAWAMGDQYRVVAQNTVGDTWDYADPGLNEIVQGGFPTITARSVSEVLAVTPPPTPPFAPSNLTATAEAGPQVSLAWTDNSLDETGFLIQRSTDGVTFSDLVTLPADSVSYVDLAVLPGLTYTYQVAAFNAGGPSAFSNTASATIPGLPGPNAPDQLAATFEPGPPPFINLQWADNSTDETGFLIQRSTDGVNFTDLATTAANVIAYNDLAVFGGFTYTYRVAAVNANGTSAFAVSNSVAVPPDATPPAAPSNLSVSNVTQTSLTLSWQDNANNETGFTIQRATDSGFTRNLMTVNVGANITSFNDSGLKRRTQYFYRVQAINGFNGGLGPFPWSPTLNVTTAR